MKAFKNIAIALCATLMLAACGGGSPEAVAKSYIDAALEFDFKKAAKYSSEEHAANLLKEMGRYSEEDLKEETEAAREDYKGITYKVIEVEVEENEAAVMLEFVKGGGTKKSEIELIKEGGKWKVDYERLRLFF